MEVTVSVTLEEKGAVEHGHGWAGSMLANGGHRGPGDGNANPESMSRRTGCAVLQTGREWGLPSR